MITGLKESFVYPAFMRVLLVLDATSECSGRMYFNTYSNVFVMQGRILFFESVHLLLVYVKYISI